MLNHKDFMTVSFYRELFCTGDRALHVFCSSDGVLHEWANMDY